jgi:hypothetical protein
MNKKLTYHFQKIINVIQSCKNEEHLLGAKLMIVNFINYWSPQLDNKLLVSYIKYINILFKHQRDKVLNYD